MSSKSRMRWVAGGPDLPEELLQLLEDGNLVIFCGAGVSYPAGLPGFRELVERIYTENHVSMEDLERDEFDRKNYDRVLGLLENRIGKARVRGAVSEILHLEPQADLSTHRALLDLATDRQDTCRLVTTNFDRGFELAARQKGVPIPIDVAPKLPVPKRGKWNSVVHLHGLISDSDPDQQTLVLTSADFGAAYLTERWAARFLADLFREFSVLFVGYSVEDPVVRYMMDALAADRAAGQSVGQAFAFAPVTRGDQDKQIAAWKAKGVTPLPYESRDDHAALHQTLERWAECHRQGRLGRESVIYEHAAIRPSQPYEQSPAVSQVNWALKESTGRVARVLADLDPVPPVEWLPVLERAGLLALARPEEARIPLVDDGSSAMLATRLHLVTSALGEWVARHLDKAEVLEWALRAGAVLHPEFRRIIQQRLAEQPPMRGGLRKIWEILASGTPLVAAGDRYLDLWTLELGKSVKDGEWNLRLKHELVEVFSPALQLKPALPLSLLSEEPTDDTSIRYFAEARVVPKCRDKAWLLLDALHRSPHADRILAGLADEATGLLRRAMELWELVEQADCRSDQSFLDQPSIAPHTQNSRMCEWTALIELCRDAWLAVLRTDRSRARAVVERWKTISYPVFRRLCFFAMAESDLYAPEECLDYLLEQNGWWLWSVYVYREKFRLLNAIWPRLSDKAAEQLVARILTGPPRNMFRAEVTSAEFERISDREIWLHLAKLESWGRKLPEAGARRLAELSSRHPGLGLAADDRDEFPAWGGPVDWGERPVENPEEFLALSDDAVMDRLTPDVNEANGDDTRWRHLVAKDPAKAARVLSAMASRGLWPHQAWHSALETIRSQKDQIISVWPALASSLSQAPDSLYESVIGPLAWCLVQVAAAPLEDEEGTFWPVWDRALHSAFASEHGEEVDPRDPLFAALNTPAGRLAEALLDRIAARKPQTGADVGPRVWERLTDLARGRGEGYVLARIILAARLSWLFQLDPAWTEQHLLGYLQWDNPEAPGFWQGFLCQPWIPPELWPKIKPSLLVALRKKNQLPEGAGEQLCRLFGLISTDRPGWISDEEAQAALRSVDAQGRSAVARVMWKRMEGAGTQGEALWEERIGPWLERAWPKDLALRDPESSLNLAMAATYAGSLFRQAVDTIAGFLAPAQFTGYLVERLLAAELPKREPRATLRLLGLVVDRKAAWPHPALRTALAQIREADPASEGDRAYRDLDEYLRRHGR